MNKNNAWIAVSIGLIAVGLIVVGVIAMSKSDKNTAKTTIETPKQTTTEVVTTTTPRGPGAPQIINTLLPVQTDTTVILKGSIVPHGGSTNYWYEYGTSENLGNKTSKQEIGSGYIARATPGYITGLTPQKSYYYRIVAENQFGRTTGDISSFQTTKGTPPPVGSIPVVRTLNASGVSRTGVTLNGEVTANRNETSYWFEYGTTKDLDEGTEVFLVGDSSTKVGIHRTVSDLKPMTTYYYRLDAQNGFGNVRGSILSFKTSGPASTVEPKVTTGTPSGVRSTTATLRGTINPNGASTEYWFEYSTGSIVGSIVPTVTDHKSIGDGTSDRSVQLDITRLESKKTYYVQLVAKNNFGTSNGERISFTTK